MKRLFAEISIESNRQMEDFTQIEAIKALADETRVRLLMALRGGELCVCQLIELVALAPSTVSKHLSILRQAGFLSARKDGRWIYYRLAGDSAPDFVKRMMRLMDETFSTNSLIKDDEKRISEIVQCDLGVICRGQRKDNIIKVERMS